MSHRGANGEIPPVALVNMPFAPAERPSIQIGILRSLLDSAAIPAREYHFSLDFFDRLLRKGSPSQYTSECHPLLSEWYFSTRPFDPDPAGHDAVSVARLQQFARDLAFPFAGMLDIRGHVVPEFLEEATEELLRSDARIICFTLSYAQLNASFALAARLKARRPDVVTVFGGAGSQVFEEACCEYLRVFPAIDVMALGEAEVVFIDLIRALQAGHSLACVPDVVYREGARIRRSDATARPLALDEAPTPNYGEWFARAARMSLEARTRLEFTLPVEMSRGCNHGDRLTCKFCAFRFHGEYRCKSKQAIAAELEAQSRRYGTRSFYVVDNMVSSQQIDEVLPELPVAVPNLSIEFIEVHPVARRSHMEILARAGVRLVQPGIECFDDRLLRKINKGTTTFQNILFLKWAREYGIRVSYNLILGLPDATRLELQNQLDVIRLIPHLDPAFPMPFFMVRFSPYYRERNIRGSQSFRADPFYGALFPDGTDIDRIAFFFQYEDLAARELGDIYQATMAAIREWRDRWRATSVPYLLHEHIEGGARIIDGRDPVRPVVHALDSAEARVHQLVTGRPGHLEGISRALPDIEPGRVESALNRLEQIHVVLRMSDPVRRPGSSRSTGLGESPDSLVPRQIRVRFLSLCLDAATVRHRPA